MVSLQISHSITVSAAMAIPVGGIIGSPAPPAADCSAARAPPPPQASFVAHPPGIRRRGRLRRRLRQRRLRRVLIEHLLHLGSATPAAMPGRGSRTRRDLSERAGAAADGALDRPILDVVATADGLQAADRG